MSSSSLICLLSCALLSLDFFLGGSGPFSSTPLFSPFKASVSASLEDEDVPLVGEEELSAPAPASAVSALLLLLLLATGTAPAAADVKGAGRFKRTG
jgi:hypothetical protein